MRGARPMGMLPTRRSKLKTLREPIKSHSGPAANRTASVATRETMFELATCAGVSFKSFLIVTVNYAKKKKKSRVRVRGKTFVYSSKTYQWRESVPCPKGKHETEPGKKEYAAMSVKGIENWDAASFLVDWVEGWLPPEVRELEAHGGQNAMNNRKAIRLSWLIRGREIRGSS